MYNSGYIPYVRILDTVFTIFRGCHIHYLEKCTVIIADIVKAAGESNVSDFFVRMGKLRAALQDTVTDQIAERCHSGETLKGTAELSFT